MSGVETLIIGGILHLPEYQGKVLPYVKSDYFTEKSSEEVFKLISEYNNNYNKLPTLESLEIELEKKVGLTEKQYQESKELIQKVFSEKFITGIKAQDQDWMLNTSENYIVDRACELAVYESHSIISGENKKLKRDAIPEILNNALSISFDTEIGHSYLDDIEKRYEFYHSKVQRIPFYLSMLDFITKGGCPRKTLTVPVAPTGVGKSVFMTNWAAELIQNGYNVLYITLEMAEERIAERIDAKLLNVTMDELTSMSKEAFMNKFKVLKRKTLGRIYVKEYQPGVCNANHIRHLLKELQTKKSFKPDVIMIDYLNLASSYRVGLNVGGYAYIKAVTEELRGLAMQNDVAVISPTQTNRCLTLDTIVNEKTLGSLKLEDVKIGMFLETDKGYNEVLEVYPKTKQKVYKITTANGFQVRCSSKHLFPTTKGLLSIEDGLAPNQLINTKKGISFITLIIEDGEEETLDIELNGNKLFYANNILTHNCGQNATDFELNEVGESHGISVTADLMFGLISTPELEQLGHLRIKQLKNRFNSVYAPSSFLVGIARAKMTLFDVDLPQTRTVVGSKEEQEKQAASNVPQPPASTAPSKPIGTPTLVNKPTLKTNLKF